MVRTRHPKLGKPPNVAILAALRRDRTNSNSKPLIGDHSYSQNPLPAVRKLRKRPRRILTVSVVDFALSYNIRYFKVVELANCNLFATKALLKGGFVFGESFS